MSTKSSQLQIRVTPAEKAELKRLAAAADQDLSAYVLSRCLPRPKLRFRELLTLLEDETETRFALAELNDLLSWLGPGELQDAVEQAGVSSLTPFLQNYIAAMVEQAAFSRGMPPPGWVADVAPLERPRWGSSFSSLRLHLLQAAPAAFKRRNIFIDSSVGARV